MKLFNDAQSKVILCDSPDIKVHLGVLHEIAENMQSPYSLTLNKLDRPVDHPVYYGTIICNSKIHCYTIMEVG